MRDDVALHHSRLRAGALAACAAALVCCAPQKVPPCVGTETNCAGACIDTTSDGKNCGGCGAACGVNESCQTSKCQCRPTFKRCGATCVDLQTDLANCGACAIACDASDRCVDGQCQCQPPHAICSGVCVDTSSDPNNCGQCAKTCADGFACLGGACVCGSGHAVCKGQCVNLQTDTSNCGACNHACDADEVCQGGTCQCPENQTNCDGHCVDTARDTANCGACGHACLATQVCTDGACACLPGDTLCNDVCVDTQTDANHCGDCGTVCPPGQPCVAGKCKQASGGVTWSGEATEQADLDDGFGDVVHRHQTAALTWTQLSLDPTGNSFAASGSVTITLTGNAGPCSLEVPATPFDVTGTLQLFPSLSPPKYTVNGSPKSASNCLSVTYTCPDGTTQMCSDLKPFLQTNFIDLPANANTLAGTSTPMQGVTYHWSFERSPKLP